MLESKLSQVNKSGPYMQYYALCVNDVLLILVQTTNTKHELIEAETK